MPRDDADANGGGGGGRFRLRGSAALMATVTQEGKEQGGREKPESFEEKKLEGKKGRWMDGWQGGVKSTPSSPRLRVGVILTDPEPAKEAL